MKAWVAHQAEPRLRSLRRMRGPSGGGMITPPGAECRGYAIMRAGAEPCQLPLRPRWKDPSAALTTSGVVPTFSVPARSLLICNQA